MTSVLNFIKIYKLVQKLLGGTQTERQTGDLISLTFHFKEGGLTRKMLTIHGQHHPRTDIDRLCVPRKKGGRGLKQVEGAYIVETLNLVEYVENKDDPLIQIVRTHQHNTNSALLQTANKFKKSFQSETKQIKVIITQNLK
jgi:hypothetical protein